MVLTSIRKIFLFLLCAMSLQANSEELHYLEFGINVGYLSNACKHRDLLERTVNDGIYLYAVRDIFYESSTMDDKLQCLSDILDLHPNVRLTLELSDYPKDGESFSALYDKYRDKLPFSYDRVKTIYTYSNRFPPSDISSYRVRLSHLLLLLEQAKLLDRVRFQIGSEPDAPLYFFGDAEDYKKILKVSRDVLQEYYENHEILCCGMTANYMVGQDERQLEFARMLDSLEVWKDGMTLSYSLFFHNSKVEMNFNGLDSESLINSVISSWNIFTYSNSKSRSVINDNNASMYYFGELLKYAYNNKINKAYYWTLMDYRQGGYLGLFDFNKGKKKIYNTFIKMTDLARNGYNIVPTGVGYDIKGKSLHIGIDRSAMNE